MKKHKFLNLKMDLVQECAMVVPLEMLEKWRARGWRSYDAPGLSRRTLRSGMLYGEIDAKRQTLIFCEPSTLTEPARVTGR